MIYHLDTNICIYIINRKPIKVLEKFEKLGPGDIGISAIAAYELYYGAYKSQAKENNLAALQDFLAPLEIVPFNIADISIAGEIRADLERRGQIIGAYDIQIAAQAIARGVILVTNNLREFKRIERLNVENWAQL